MRKIINITLAILLILFAFAIILMPLAIGQSDLVFKQLEEFDLKVPVFFNNTIADNETTCNITIFQPNGNTLFSNRVMTNQVTFHNITLSASDTQIIGDHTASIFCNSGSNNGFSTFTYLISPSGVDDDSIAQLILLSSAFLFSVGLIWFGFNRQDGWFALFGGILLIVMGLYILLNGVGLYRNTLTDGMSLVILGFAGYVVTKTGLELING